MSFNKDSEFNQFVDKLKDKYKSLSRKNWEWRSFYNGGLEAFGILKQIEHDNKINKVILQCGTELSVKDHFYEWEDEYKYHIVSIIKDNGKTFFITKFFGKHKQYWHYEIKSSYTMNLWFKDNLFAKNKNDLRK